MRNDASNNERPHGRREDGPDGDCYPPIFLALSPNGRTWEQLPEESAEAAATVKPVFRIDIRVSTVLPDGKNDAETRAAGELAPLAAPPCRKAAVTVRDETARAGKKAHGPRPSGTRMPTHAPMSNGSPSVRIRTFGFFDVFVDGKPIAFRNRKSKELLALLVDRRGGFVDSEEAIGFLWENESANPVTLSRYRKVALRLKNTLSEYGISEIVESVNGKRRLVVDEVSCDLYDYLSGNDEFERLFKGSYLSNYSWSEITLAELTGERLGHRM